MSRFCVGCGSQLNGSVFCGNCGQAAADESATVQSPASQSPGPGLDPNAFAPASQDLPPKRGRRGAVVGAIAVALSVGALTVFAINTQVQDDSAAQATAAQAEEEEQKRIEAKAKKIADKQIAEERAEMEAEAERSAAPSEQQTQPTSQAAVASGVDGSWSGTMNSGKYSFSLDLYQDGSTLSGSMYQYDNSDGEDGTQQMTGYREGNTLYLRGTSWSGAPSTWGLDSIVVTVSSGGSSFSGSYGCDVCSGTKDISGSRSGGGY